MENTLEKCTIHFLKKPYPENTIIPIQEDEIYGSCVVQVDPGEIITKQILFHFMIDVSGSMSDATENGRSKIQLLIHTLINMIHYLAENTQNVYIQVKGFDDRIHNYVDITHVSKENVDEMIDQLKSIRPLHLTNIELALTTLKNDIETISNQDYEQVGIFLTDGDATAGETLPSNLATKIPSTIPFHFIALGNEHNPYLMHHLGHCTKYSNNWYINEIEQTGNIYGEILYNELHRVGKQVVLEIHNGQLYDYYAQEFVTCLHLGSLYSETKKHYHIFTKQPDQCFLHLKGKDCNTEQDFNVRITDLPPLISVTDIEVNSSFQSLQPHFNTIQYFRLATQIFMGKARNLLLNKNELFVDKKIHEKNIMRHRGFMKELIQTSPRDNHTDFYNEIEKFKTNMNHFMELYNIQDNEYMNCLCDDISMLLNTFGYISQLKYCALREDIQGQERTCNAITMIHNNDLCLINNLDSPNITRTVTTPYRTPGRTNLMHTISQDIEDTENTKDTEQEKINNESLSINVDVLNFFDFAVPPILRRTQSMDRKLISED